MAKYSICDGNWWSGWLQAIPDGGRRSTMKRPRRRHDDVAGDSVFSNPRRSCWSHSFDILIPDSPDPSFCHSFSLVVIPEFRSLHVFVSFDRPFVDHSTLVHVLISLIWSPTVAGGGLTRWSPRCSHNIRSTFVVDLISLFWFVVRLTLVVATFDRFTLRRLISFRCWFVDRSLNLLSPTLFIPDHWWFIRCYVVGNLIVICSLTTTLFDFDHSGWSVVTIHSFLVVVVVRPYDLLFGDCSPLPCLRSHSLRCCCLVLFDYCCYSDVVDDIVDGVDVVDDHCDRYCCSLLSCWCCCYSTNPISKWNDIVISNVLNDIHYYYWNDKYW